MMHRLDSRSLTTTSVTQRILSLSPYRRASFNGGIIGVYHRYGVITTLLVDVLLSILLSADPLDVRQSSQST